MMIYKIFHTAEWADLQAHGETLGAPIDLSDGFVHFSTASQVEETAARHFAGQANLFLLAIDPEQLGSALRWESSRGGELFPHLYSALKLSDVLWAKALPLIEGTHVFPPELHE